jgi:translation initiation factor 4G
MMGLGIIAGQVYAGMVGPIKGWQYPFFVAAIVQLITTALMAIYVAEPVRGGMEKSLRNVQYNRKLTWQGFVHAMQNNASNSVLIWQGFVTSIPWGVVLVFLNDYLSQEKGFSVPEATVMVMLFGVGCGIGGVLGGYIGGILMSQNRSYLPLYMATATFLGIFPFLFLLNTDFPHHNGYNAKLLSILGGTVASLPSVNVRPCVINVNLPETRGAARTAANLLVTLGRGIGPACIVLMGSIFAMSRQTSFNVTLLVFWTVAALQLVLLAKTLPNDMDAVEAALEHYAATAGGTIGQSNAPISPVKTETSRLLLPSSPGGNRIEGDGDTILSIEDLTIAFDGTAARRSLEFMRLGLQELNDEITHRQRSCLPCDNQIEDEDSTPHDTNSSLLEEHITDEEIQRRRDVWLHQQQQDCD